MSDVAPSPSPVKGKQASKNQVILVAALGVVLLLVLVFMVLKPFGGGDDTSAPVTDTSSVTTPAAGTAPAAGTGTAVGAPAGGQATTFEAVPRGRNPFDPPR